MPDQLETPETDAELFDRWLVEAPTSEFEEFIENAPQWLRTKSSEFLRDCQALVEARVAAEPVKNCFCMSDPHEIRLRYWDKIADKFRAEINFRNIRLGGSAETTQESVRTTRGGDPEVTKRRSVVERNRDKSGKELCKLFDYHEVRLPREWQDDFSIKSWDEAYQNKKLRHAIESLISRDKRATAKS